MCGFFGNFAHYGNKIIANSRLKEISNFISHRGPDGEGFYEDQNVSLAFKRLSIIDIKNGNQPFHSQNGKYVIVFNGEIYNYSSIRSQLVASGIKLKTNSDTETLLEALSLWGVKYINNVNGMFSFILYDKKANKIYLVRDRLGIKPLYYTKVGNNYLFSSEINAILKTNLINKKVNLNAISSYLSFRNPIGVGTFFEEIKEVQPGEIISINEKIEKSKYWEIPIYNEKKDYGEKNFTESTLSLFKNIVQDHMVSDVPIGSLLSGGLDSSLLTVLMNKKNLKTFSASFDSKDYDEISFAKIISNQINSEHFNIVLDSQKYLDKLETNIIKRSIPLSIPHEIALNELFNKIKDHSKVVMSGEGADELFGGYGRVQSSAFDFKKILFIKNYFPKFTQKYFFELFGQNSHLDWEKYNSQNEHFLDIYSWFSPINKKNILSDEFHSEIQNDHDIKKFWYSEFEKVKNLDEYDRILYIFQKHHLRCLLDRLDFHSMASSVEARVPFCDHRLVEHAMKIPFKYKFKWKSLFHKLMGIFDNSFNNSENLDISKFLLRKCSENIIPTTIINRKKKGFPVPLDNWFSKNSNAFAKEILLDDQTRRRGLFNNKEIENLLNNQEKLDFDFWGKKIWMLVNIEIWYRKVVSE